MRSDGSQREGLYVKQLALEASKHTFYLAGGFRLSEVNRRQHASAGDITCTPAEGARIYQARLYLWSRSSCATI